MTLAWTAHPAKRRPQDAMLAACVIALASYAVLVGLESGWLALVAAVILVVAIAPFLVPTHYTLDASGISERRLFVTRSRPWTTLRRVDIGRAAALVSPYAQRRWLDRYRGMTIYFDGGERDAVIRALAEHVRT
jgi:hypothetical protein